MEQLARDISSIMGFTITTQYLWANKDHVVAWLKEKLEYGDNDRIATEAARLYRLLV